jgi:uncharacterized BrkB/YihY/UPF0761 family membrane protein
MKINNFQKKHTFFAFLVAVIKKYSDDQAGRQAALLTYYAFLSLFPLLLVLTTLTNNLVGRNPDLNHTIITGLTNYFPLLGSQLASHVHGLDSGGSVVVIGILFTLYGTRGVADVFRSGMQEVWGIPKSERVGFPKSTYNSFQLIVVGGTGFILTSIIAGYASSTGRGVGFKVLSILINVILLFTLYIYLMNHCLPKRVTIKKIWLGAIIAAIGLVILQLVGGLILSRELKKLDVLYSYFAVALGLLFWLYLQCQVLYYAVEIAVVKNKKLWPRSLNSSSPTIADKLIADTSR